MGYTKEPVETLDERVAAPPPRGAPAAREALLPAAAHLGGAAVRRRGPAHPRGARPSGSPRSASPTRPRRCGTSRRSPRASPAPPTSSASCCRRCSTGSPRRPTRTPGCSGSASSASRWAGRRGTSRRSATRARSPSGWPGCSPRSRYASDLLEKEPAGVRMLGEDLAPLDGRADRRGDALRGRPPRRPGGRGPRDPRRTPPRAVPRRGRRPLGAHRRGRRRRRAVADHRRHARGDAPGGHGVGRAAQRARRAAGPDGDRRDGPLRRLRAVLRQRRRRAVRARARRGRRPARGHVVRHGRRPTSCAGCSRCPAATRRSTSTPTCGPRASRGRCRAAWTPTPPTTPSGRRSGRRRRCSAPTPWSATPSCGAGSWS